MEQGLLFLTANERQ